MREFHIIGNWKMNQSIEDVKNFFKEFNSKYPFPVGIAPQFIHLGPAKEASYSSFWIGSQNICEYEEGAYTGEVSAKAIKDMNLDFTLIGHSERRSIYGENSETLNNKMKRAIENNLKVIFCVGETLNERESKKTNQVIKKQIKDVFNELDKDALNQVIVAYEPVWAIGTGKTATPKMAQEVHHNIRSLFLELGLKSEQIPIVYGGSVRPENAKDLLSQKDIDGALIGGASLKVSDFTHICDIAKKLAVKQIQFSSVT